MVKVFTTLSSYKLQENRSYYFIIINENDKGVITISFHLIV